MGGKAGSPDYEGLAIQQGEFDQDAINQQTWANRPDQYTPWGYNKWTSNETIDPSTGKPVTSWSQTSGLTPELQDILNKQIAIQGGRTDVAGMLTGRLGQNYGQQMNWDNLSPMGYNPVNQFTAPEGGIDDPYQTRQRAEDAVFSQASSRLDPMFQGKNEALEIKLRNQGIGPEDAAWQAQMGALSQQENDARNQAMWSAVGEGRQESGQMFGQQLGLNQNRFNQSMQANNQNYQQAMQGSQYANQIRQQQMAEMMQQRGFNLNEINAIMSGQQVGMPSMPSFQGANSAPGAPVAAAGAAQGNFDQASSPWGGLANLAGSALGAYGTYAGLAASDRRLKRNIRRVGTVAGHPWYSFDYVWGESSQGVMSDEIPQEFVVTTPGGYDAVDYGRLLC